MASISGMRGCAGRGDLSIPKQAESISLHDVFCQIKHDLDNLNVSGLVVVWGVLADMLSGKFQGLGVRN